MPLTTPRLRFVWKTMVTYRAVYQNPRTGGQIVIRALTPQPKIRVFRSAGGNRKFKRVEYTQQKKEVLIVAKSRKTASKTEDVVDQDLDELDELEDLEDLEEELEEEEEDEEEPEDEEEEEDDDLEDEEDDDFEDEDEDEDEEEEEEEAPRRRSRKPAAKKSKVSRSKSTDGKVGTQEVADHFGTDARTLRMVLRKNNIPKNADTARYEWSSLKHPQVIKIGKLIKSGAAERVKKESLDNLKNRKTTGAKRTKSSGTASKTSNAKRSSSASRTRSRSK